MTRDVDPLESTVGADERRLVDAAWAQFERIANRSSTGSSAHRHPLQIAGYRLLGEIHRGGQGVVYQAIQESTQRKMAIKVLKEGPFADRIELARFEREVDVLSRLVHPHIVAIHDRGLSAGHAYYVMDYIAGRSIDAYVAGANLSIEETLAQFIKVCEAVNFAHLRGVIHRDLKPGNIRIDELGEPRILDFGLVKLAYDVAGSSCAPTMTLTGQFVGSLPWASPEQAEGDSASLDIRTDVYSLGVILYQLLTGQFPYPVVGKVNEIMRQIAHSSPVRPSTLRHNFDREVELIVLKCLAKEPERRYQSAGELARDLRHFLVHEPISATSPSAIYRVRKFVRRNRAAVFAGLAVSAALVIATAVSLVFALSEARERLNAEAAKFRAESAEAETAARANELEQVAKFQEEQLSGIDAKAMGMQLRAGLLEGARAAAARSTLPEEARNARAAELENLVAGADFTGMALDALDENFFQPALAAIEKQFADQPLVKAQLLQTLASTLPEVGLLDAASKPQEEALAIRRRMLGEDHPDTLTSISETGLLMGAQGKLAEAEPYHREALDKRRLVLGDEHVDTLRSIHNLGALLQEQGKLKEAEPLYREALEKRRRILGEEHRDTLTSLSSMGYLLEALGEREQAGPYYREALEKRRRVLGDDHPHTLFSINNMAAFHQMQLQLTEAEVLYREALERRRRVLGDNHPDTLQSLNNLGNLLQAQRKSTEAEPYYRETLEKRRRVLGDDHPHTLNSIANLGTLLSDQDRYAEAEPLTREALEKRRRLLGNDHPDTIISVNNLGILLKKQGRLAEAEPYLREALEAVRRARGNEHPSIFRALINLSDLLQNLGKPQEAAELLAGAESTASRTFTGASAPKLGRFLIALGHARVAAAQFEAAEENLLKAHQILTAAEVSPEWDPADVFEELAKLFEAWHAAEPDQGHDAQAVAWRAKLAECLAPTQSPAP
jgi:non-specific serine/threonine protein kinase/serine/threonine-protein kinase